ncbi:IS30 family transposase [Capnocytophaga canimorsus]|uniref:IS30 family transposase n=1 Tax=Capnocytophaga canimorsus TaxID=28188 RepID=UPI00385EBC57
MNTFKKNKNNKQFFEHQYISEKLSCNFYFANPYCSWERGLSENTNKLVRQYFPKGTYFEKISKEKIKEIQHKINRRPRTAKHITNTLTLKTIKSE